MLRELDIRDMLVIDRLTIDFQPGLNVLTGETGAGKSILLDSIGFALGWRGRSNLVRSGAEKGEVTAVFELPEDHAARAILHEGGYDDEDDLILRRTTTPDGRKTAYVNDRRASGEVMRRLGETLVELHGQHDDRGLLNKAGHRNLLDEFGELNDQRQSCAAAWDALRAATAAVTAHAEELAALKAEEEFLRHAAEELQVLSPEVGEEATLDGRRRMMQAGARVGEDVSRAAAALGDNGAEGQIRDATRWLESAAAEIGDKADPALAALSQAMTNLGDGAAQVEALIGELSVDQSELEAIEDRLFAIRGLARKHKCLPDKLPELLAGFDKRIQALDGSSDTAAALEKHANDAQVAFDKIATKLSNARKKHAVQLDKAVMGELAPLKMERSVFQTIVSDAEPGPSGCDAVEFTVATNPGTPQGPLGKIASGGELSRFLLALKVSLSRTAKGDTIIFDEIDRGVGGATADAVGRRLARLAENAQILVVTHSPQVAALGRHHWQISKEVIKEQTFSRVAGLRPDDRVDEIARMISGDRITEAARAAARELLST